MTPPRHAATPHYARDLVPAVGLAVFAVRVASPALNGSRPLTPTAWMLIAFLSAGALLLLALAARAERFRVEGDDLTRWSGLRPWHTDRRPLASVHDAAQLERGTLIAFDDGALWRVPASHRGGETLGRWVVGNGIRSDVAPPT